MGKEKDNGKATKKEVRTAIENAYVVLGYACENGLLPDDQKDTVEIIVKAKHSKEMSADDISGFWLAYSRLTTFLKAEKGDCKVSAESIISIEQTARKSITRYEISGFIILLIMLVVQVYWIVGAGFISDMKTIPDQIDKLELETEARRTILDKKAANDKQVDLMKIKIANLRLELNSSASGLKNWLSVVAYPIQWFKINQQASVDNPLSDSSKRVANQIKTAGMGNIASNTQAQIADDPTEEVNTYKRYSAFVLETIQSYILPILYGLLGAFAYVLRNISQQITDQTYNRESEIKGLLRLHLGALAGLAVGWVFGQGPDSTVTVTSLSPLALAFMGGYSVEFVFNGIDRLIASVASKTAPAQSSGNP